MMRTLHFLVVSHVAALALAMSAPVAAQTEAKLPLFGSVELHNGGKVILRHGPTQRVTLLKGSADATTFTVAAGGLLVIDKCKSGCPRGSHREIEVVMPDVSSISVNDGGTIESRGSFPRREAIAVAVSNGGTIDIRSMMVDKVNASVEEGGRILTKPRTFMFATVRNGGIVSYWGDPEVKSSVEGGGVVTKGADDEVDKPISEFNSLIAPVPPIPPVPPIHTMRKPM